MSYSRDCCCRGGNGDGGGRPPGGGTPPGGGPAPLCTTYEVVFTTINTTKSDDGFASGELEVQLAFTVNAQTQIQQFFNTALQLGTTQLSLQPFIVNIPTSTSVISVSIQAEEQDGNQYTGHQRTFAEADNWGMGAHTGNLGGPNEALIAAVDYNIACAKASFMVMSRSTLIAYATDAASRRKITAPSSDLLLSWSIGRLARNHWEITQVMGDDFLLRGYGTFARRVAERFAGGADRTPLPGGRP
jgi:hypothetical protein